MTPAVAIATVTPLPPTPVIDREAEAKALAEQSAKLYIYNHESGNNPSKWNSSGCVGLGQACPASKLLKDCSVDDYGCQDTWFTGYMTARYGSWANAKSFWIRTDCRPYCGNWW